MNNIFELIKEDWGDHSSIQLICTRICEYLLSVNKYPDYYTFDHLRSVVKQGNLDDADVVKAIMYLATPRLNLLKVNLMYEWRDLILDLPRQEVVNYSENEPEKYPVIHPKTGEVMTEEEIFVCFLPGSVLKNNNEAEL